MLFSNNLWSHIPKRKKFFLSLNLIKDNFGNIVKEIIKIMRKL